LKVLCVGAGGREHALAWAIRRSPRVDQLWIAPGNAGTTSEGENVDIAATDIAAAASSSALIGVGVHPTRTAVPAMDKAIPAALGRVMGSRIQKAAMTVVNSGTRAFRIEAVEASMVRTASAISMNGTAVPITATTSQGRQWRRQSACAPVASMNPASSRPAESTRSSIISTEPRCGTATRMKRYEAPHIAPRATRRAASCGLK